MQSIAIKQTQNDRVWAYTTMAAVFALLFIWVVPNTIALRHVLLVVAFLASVMVIRANAELLVRARTAMFPLVVLSLLFIWVGIHYFFFSLNPELELKEISSLWVRTFLGFVAAIGLGISLRKYPELMKFFYIAVFLTPILNVGSYFYASYLKGVFLPPGAIIFFLFAKIETAYFGAIAGAVAVGNLIQLLTNQSPNGNKKYILLFSAGLILVMASSILSSTKNGVAIQVFLYLFLAVALVGSYVASRQFFNLKNLAIISLILVTLGMATHFHKKTASAGWNTIFADVAVAIDIDQHTQWQKREGSVAAPLNHLGKPVAMNTYSRAAYAAAGVRLIGMYPFGYGSINQSFAGMQKHAGIQSEHGGQIHSGWIDFGLAFGVPGLAIVFLTLLSTIYLGLRSRLQTNLVPVVICITLIPFCLIAETSYKQYFESLIFFIALSASLVVFNVFTAVRKSATTQQG
jgi:nitrate reductase NapE component